jgi:hypothetical protein
MHIAPVVWHVLSVMLKTFLVTVIIGLVVYIKYRRAKQFVDQRDYKADVETLFGGKQ